MNNTRLRIRACISTIIDQNLVFIDYTMLQGNYLILTEWNAYILKRDIRLDVNFHLAIVQLFLLSVVCCF